MKYGKIIKPEDVPVMMRSGELEFGILLEFGDTPEFYPIYTRILIFCGFMKNTGEFLCRYKNESTPRLYKYARFPLPNLKDGDPVICQSCKSSVARNAVFKSFHRDGGIMVWENGRNRWTRIQQDEYFPVWRLPTKKELKEAGIENWYDGRIELEDE